MFYGFFTAPKFFAGRLCNARPLFGLKWLILQISKTTTSTPLALKQIFNKNGFASTSQLLNFKFTFQYSLSAVRSILIWYALSYVGLSRKQWILHDRTDKMRLWDVTRFHCSPCRTMSWIAELSRAWNGPSNCWLFPRSNSDIFENKKIYNNNSKYTKLMPKSFSETASYSLPTSLYETILSVFFKGNRQLLS